MIKRIIIANLLFLTLIFAAGCIKAENETHETHIDLDLTALSGVMVQSAVFDMMTKPQDYLGQTIKVRGKHHIFYNDTGRRHHYLAIEDDSGCCTQWIEFVLSDVSAENYPSENTNIEITGVFSSYEEQDDIFYYLRVYSEPLLF